MLILIVEDDFSQAESLRESLYERWSSAQLPVISTEAEFRLKLPEIISRPPDLIFLDLMLRWTNPTPELLLDMPSDGIRGWPQEAGFRCAKLLAANDATRDVPVIIYSVLDRVDVAQQLLEMPPNVRYLQKTSTPKQMMQLAASLIATHREVTPMPTVTRDVFICHAREDRETIVDPIVRALEAAGISVWHDRAEIRWGDSLIGKIQEGLNNSRYVLAVISRHSVTKPWPQKELSSALSGEISNGAVKVLPLIVGSEAERADILRHLSLHADKLYEIWTGAPEYVVEKIRQRLA